MPTIEMHRVTEPFVDLCIIIWMFWKGSNAWRCLTKYFFLCKVFEVLVLSLSCHPFSSPTSVWHYKKIIFWQYQGKCWIMVGNLSKKSLSVLKQHLLSFSNGNGFFCDTRSVFSRHLNYFLPSVSPCRPGWLKFMSMHRRMWSSCCLATR